MKQPNVILIMTDQQRWDTVAGYGYPHMITPHLDSLVNRGVAFSHAFVQGTVCGPSRNSIVSAKYVHSHGVERNEQWIPDTEPNWIEQFKLGGYHTVNIGKMHTAPLRLPCGFEHRLVVENKNYEQGKMGPPDDYDLFLEKQGLVRPAQHYYETVDDWFDHLGAVIWPYQEALYPDNFIGNHAIEYLESYAYDRPLFMWVGFAGPHDPYDVTKSAWERYEGVEIPDPVRYQGEAHDKPPEHAEAMNRMDKGQGHAAICWSRATPERIREMRRHYYANVTLIDDWVGRILHTLISQNQLEDTIIVFTSDHGDCLGDHDHIYKFWAHYEPIVRVPLIFAGPGIQPLGVRDTLVEMIDLGPTLLETTSLQPIDACQGRSMACILSGDQDGGRNIVFSEQGHRLMVRNYEWKLVYYAGKPYGELYRIDQDPHELNNLYDCDEYAHARSRMTDQLMDWYVDTRYIREKT